MTALTRYQRLECTGLWREGPGAQRREVGVSFGEATLVIAELRSGRALAHWSLPAVTQLNPGDLPAVYAPGPDAPETLEVDDLEMVAAIAHVRAALDRGRHRGPGLRGAIGAATAAAVLALGVLWLPGALVEHTASVVPFAKRAEIGARLLRDIAAGYGEPCRAPQALAALERFRSRLLGPAGGEIVVLRGGVEVTAHLPGRLVLLSRRLVEAPDSPEPAAGAVLAERLRSEASDPMVALLRAAGLRATFTLLTTGDLPGAALAGQAERILATPPAEVAPEALLARMAAAGVPATPYALFVVPGGADMRALVEGDPFRGIAPPQPLLSDDDWVRLQGICGG